MGDFRPPLHNPLVNGFVKVVLPLVLQQEKLEVRPLANCIMAIRRLAFKHTVIMVNHSDRSDPVSVFSLSKLCGENFYYLAARELFDDNFGLRGWVMQRCGSYSVVRGHPIDAESKEMTISLIAEGKRKLIMFPEGDVTGRDDTILPLKEDGIRNLFEAQERLVANESVEPVYLLPVAIFYQVTDDAMQPLRECLGKLETLLGVFQPESAFEPRINRLIEALLDHLEDYYGMQSTPPSNLGRRVLHLCKHATMAIANAAGVQVDKAPNESVLLYSVRGEVEKLRDTGCRCQYCAHLQKQSLRKNKAHVFELDRIQQLLILERTMQEQPFTPEVAWRLIDRLELELTGQVTAKGHRIAWMEAAEPISVAELRLDYQRNENRAINRIDHLVRDAINGALQQLKKSEPVTKIMA